MATKILSVENVFIYLIFIDEFMEFLYILLILSLIQSNYTDNRFSCKIYIAVKFIQ